MKLENFEKRDLRLLKTILQLLYETTPEQLRWILAKLRELLLGHPMVTPEPARVRFVDFGAYFKNLEIFAYLRCQDQDAFLAIREDILLRVEETSFARAAAASPYLRRRPISRGQRASTHGARVPPKRRSACGEREGASRSPNMRSTSASDSRAGSITRRKARLITRRQRQRSSHWGARLLRPLRSRIWPTSPRWLSSCGLELRLQNTSSISSQPRRASGSRSTRAAQMRTSRPRSPAT